MTESEQKAAAAPARFGTVADAAISLRFARGPAENRNHPQ